MLTITEEYNLHKINPRLSKQWHRTKNGKLSPKDVAPNSNRKAWWICNKGHEWEARINARNGGNGCPYCAGLRVCEDNCLQTINPRLSKEWHPIKNRGLTPKDVTPGSHKRVWWLCSKGHEWQAEIWSRNGGTGCPYCSGRFAHDGNCLQTIRPDLSKQWHPTRNGKLTPRDVTPGSDKKVWWVCSNGHEWRAIVHCRNAGTGCPYCSGRFAHGDNCLQAVNPKLSKQWHPIKNGRLTPSDVTPYSHKRVWWICSKGHEWQAIVGSRNRGSGCPHCTKGKSKRELIGTK